MRTYDRKKQVQAAPAAISRKTVEQDLAWASGTEQFYRIDPIAHVTESFHMNFDRIGRRHAQALGGQMQTDEASSAAAPGGLSVSEQGKMFSGDRGMAQGSGMQDRSRLQDGRQDPRAQVMRGWASPAMLQTFSETAFQRGTLSGAVLEGTGKMMLISCLKRTVGQNMPKHIQDQTIFRTGSQLRNVPGRSPDQMIFNRNSAKSAIGLVVDTLRDARRVVDSMTEMTQGTGELEKAGDSGTLFAMYPFLDDRRERTLIDSYSQQLMQTSDFREKSVLQNALVHAQALLNRKTQMKNEFINKLRFISDRATETLSELETPEAEEEIAAALMDVTDMPEDLFPGAEGDGDDPDKTKGGSGSGDFREEDTEPSGAESEPAESEPAEAESGPGSDSE